jgi:transmembrane 9 superfamily protein 2/4
LGQILMGERIRHSPYDIRMRNDVRCEAICKRSYKWEEKSTKKNKRKEFRKLFNAIKKDYMHHWIVDNLPAVECTSNCRGGREIVDGEEVHRFPYYRLGFPVGCAIGPARKSMTVCTVNTIANMYPEETFLNNHIDIVIDFHEAPEFTGARIVGVQVSPRSLGHKSTDSLDCGPTVGDAL